MNNERGEVATGIMVVMMVGMMILGAFFMHGGHGGHGDHGDGHGGKEQTQADSKQHPMHDHGEENEHVPTKDSRE